MPDVLSTLYTKKQLEVLQYYFTHDFFMLIQHGAKRSGKTYVNNVLFLAEVKAIRKRADAAGVKDPQMILAGATAGTVDRNVLTELRNVYGMDFKFDKQNRFRLFGVLVFVCGHSSIMDLARIRGMTAWGAYINEASLANQMVFNEIQSRCSAPGARIIIDTNPDRPSHWLKTDFIDKADGKTTAEFHWRLDDNTTMDQRYRESIKHNTASGLFYDRDINGLWVSAEGVVYPDFDRDVHYVNSCDVPPITRYWAGMDFGWEHFGALVLLGEADNGDVYLLREWSGQHMSIDAWARIINEDVYEIAGPVTVYCDSARPDLIDSLQSAGIDARNAHKDVIAGIGEVATMFKQRRLYVVSDGVDRFKTEVDQYAWRPGRDEPIKVNDDVMDAMRYGIYSDRVEHEQSCWLNVGDSVSRGV